MLPGIDRHSTQGQPVRDSKQLLRIASGDLAMHAFLWAGRTIRCCLQLDSSRENHELPTVSARLLARSPSPSRRRGESGQPRPLIYPPTANDRSIPSPRSPVVNPSPSRTSRRHGMSISVLDYVGVRITYTCGYTCIASTATLSSSEQTALIFFRREIASRYVPGPCSSSRSSRGFAFGFQRICGG